MYVVQTVHKLIDIFLKVSACFRLYFCTFLFPKESIYLNCQGIDVSRPIIQQQKMLKPVLREKVFWPFRVYQKWKKEYGSKATTSQATNILTYHGVNTGFIDPSVSSCFSFLLVVVTSSLYTYFTQVLDLFFVNSSYLPSAGAYNTTLLVRLIE